MADKNLSKQEQQRLKEKEQFERERKKWKQQESRNRIKKTRKKDSAPVLFKTLAVVLAAAVVLGLGSIYAGSYGVPGRFMPALSVGGQNIDAPVWAFNFYFAYRQVNQYGALLGLDTSVSLFGQNSSYTRDGTENSPAMTWDEYFRKQVNTSLQNEFALYSEAKKAGFQLDEENQKSLEDMMTELKGQATNAAMSVGAYLRHSYIAGMTESKYRKLQERLLMVQGFTAQKQEEFLANYTDEMLQAEYDKDPDAYNQVDYRVYKFDKAKLTANEGESAEALAARQAASDADAKKKAEAFLSGGEEGFLAAAQADYDAQHVHEEDEDVDHEHNYDADTATLSLSKKKAELVSTYGEEDFADWFFAAERKAGDSTTWETDSSVYAAYLKRPAYAQTTVDIYAIDVPLGEHEHGEDEEHSDDEATPQEEAKKQADALLAKWKEDGGTKEAFASLAAEQPNPIRAGAEAEPGLLEKTAPGDMPELAGWVFDPARKEGEAAVLQTSAGYAVIYLSSQNADDFVWKQEIADTFAQADYEAYVTDLQEQYPLGYHGIGMRYALKDAQKMCDTYMEYAVRQSSEQ